MAMNKTAAGKYVVDFWYFDEGKRKRRERTFTKKKEATAFYESTRSKVRDNEYTPPSKHSVKEMCEQYLAATKARVKVQTYLQYKRHVDNYIVPAFGERRMTELGFAEIEKGDASGAKRKTSFRTPSIKSFAPWAPSTSTPRNSVSTTIP